jgi:hypothetical protein
MTNINKHIAKEFISLDNKETVRMSHDFNDLFFTVSRNPELLDCSLMVFKIVLKVINDLRAETFNKSDSKLNAIQLNMFESTFKTTNNSYANFVYKIKDLDKNRNYNVIESSLVFLTEYLNGTHTHVNSRTGETYKFIGGFISNPEYTKGKVSFLISSYFIEKIVSSDMYNDVLVSCVEKLREPKYILFYFWLLRLKAEGTTVNFETLVSRYGLNYDTYDELYKNFLFPLRKKLNAISNVSFNFKKLPGNKIAVSKQYLTPSLELSESTLTSLNARRRSHYFKIRHKLSDKDLILMREVLKKNENLIYINNIYSLFIKDCRLNKVNADTFTGENFLKKLQEIIIETKNKDIKLI